jgi:hypothetical protein
MQLMDTNNRILKKPFFELSIPSYRDTTIGFNVSVLDDQNNNNRIDSWGYNPYATEKDKRFSLFIKASDVSLATSKTSQKNKKVEFIRLANSIDFVKLGNSTLAGNTSGTIPLTVFLNATNVFGQQPLLGLFFFGNSQVGKYSTINYNFQTTFHYFISNQIIFS